MKDYFVGIDFRSEPTAAWIVPASVSNPTGISFHGDILEINGPLNETISSVVYFDKDGKHCLFPSPFLNMVSLSLPFDKMESNHKVHYKNFVRLVVEKLLSMNNHVLKITQGVPNFEIYIPTPSNPSEIDFLNEATAELNIKFQTAIGANEAIYFALINPESDKGMTVLVVNTTAYSIDCTLMRNGLTIHNGHWKNKNLGTGNIERLMLDACGTGYDGLSIHEKMAVTSEKLRSKGITHINPYEHLMRVLRKKRQFDDIVESNDFYIRYRFIECTADPDFLNPQYEFSGNYESVTAPYREEVRKYLAYIKNQILKLNGGNDPDIIIPAGEAVTMSWFVKLLSEIFPDKNVRVGRLPNHLVAEGVANYGRKLTYSKRKTVQS